MEGIGQLVATTPVPTFTVPASAVVTDAKGATCLFESVQARPIPVKVTGGGLATVEIPRDTPVRQVLANPLQVRAETACS